MKNFVLKTAINAVALWVAAFVVSGIHLGADGKPWTSKLVTIVLVALLFGLVNAILGPVARFLSGKECIKIVQRTKSHSVSGFARGRTDVRQKEDVVEFGKLGVATRFGLENIKAGGSQVTAFQGMDQSIFVNQVASRRIHKDRTFSHQRQAPRIHQVRGFRRCRAIE